MLQKFIVPLLIALIALLTLWLAPDDEQQTALPVNVSQQAPDSFMDDFTTQVLDKRGQLQYELHAKHMAHYPHDDHADLRQPELTVFPEQEDAYWQAQAEEGVLDNQQQTIMLHGAVNIDKMQADTQRSSLNIKTREVLVIPATAYAETGEYTLITQGTSRVETQGLRAFFNEDRVQLLSQVRGVYEPRP